MFSFLSSMTCNASFFSFLAQQRTLDKLSSWQCIKSSFQRNFHHSDHIIATTKALFFSSLCSQTAMWLSQNGIIVFISKKGKIRAKQLTLKLHNLSTRRKLNAKWLTFIWVCIYLKDVRFVGNVLEKYGRFTHQSIPTTGWNVSPLLWQENRLLAGLFLPQQGSRSLGRASNRQSKSFNG